MCVSDQGVSAGASSFITDKADRCYPSTLREDITDRLLVLLCVEIPDYDSVVDGKYNTKFKELLRCHPVTWIAANQADTVHMSWRVLCRQVFFLGCIGRKSESA